MGSAQRIRTSLPSGVIEGFLKITIGISGRITEINATDEIVPMAKFLTESSELRVGNTCPLGPSGKKKCSFP